MNAMGRNSHSGFSYIEVLVAIALIAIALVPALEALHSGIQGSQIHADEADNHYWLGAKLAEVRALSYLTLLAATDDAGSHTTVVASLSDAEGENKRRLVYLSRYDGDNLDADDDPFTGVDDGLLWLRVEIAGQVHSLETLVRQ